MSAAEDVARYLAAQGEGTYASDIFVNHMPDDTNDMLSVYDTPGFPPEHAMGTAGGQYVLEHPGVQVLVRNSNGETAESKARSVFNRLAGLAKATLNGNAYGLILATQSPFFLSKDVNGRVIFSCNYTVSK